MPPPSEDAEQLFRISVIIPALNEQAAIGRCIQAARASLPDAEILVVDGASMDRTVETAHEFRAVRVIESPRGRALQMNAGASAAQGDVLLFLHADVQLPPTARSLIAKALSNPAVVGGAFRTWTVSDTPSALEPLLHLADLRSRYSSLPYGDQAIFVRAAIFRQLQGFPEQSLMEDLEFSEKLRSVGRVQILPASVRVSGRRFLAHPIRYFALLNLFPLLYRLGVSPARLAQWYGNPR